MQVMKTVDTRGLFCPIPLTIVSKELKNINVGEKIKVLADDKAFKKDISIWAFETGNKLVDFKEENGVYIAIIQRGKGFKGENIWDKVKFVSLGVKLHIKKHLLDIFFTKKPKYLITFVSVAEGLRADKWIKENQKNFKYVMLPVPKEIYPHCGLVFGTKNKDEALKIYQTLKDKNFAVEDIHVVDKNKNYPKLEV